MVGEVAEGDISKEDGSIVHGIHGVAIEHIINRKNKNGYKSVSVLQMRNYLNRPTRNELSGIARD